jgi:WD40 repeat protein
LPPEKKWGGWNWAAFSPDARLLVGTGGDGDVLFRRLSPRAHLTGSRLLQKTPAHQDFGRAVAVSPDGKLVATGTDDILLWDSATRKIVSRFADVSSVWSLAFSPDGRWLVSAHGDGSLQVWDLNDRRRTAGFDGHGNHVLVVAYAPDGKRIASAGKDGAVMVWQVQTEQKEATLFGHETRIVNLAFAPDGSWLASFDQDGYLIRWDLETMVPRWKIKAHSGSACLTISPDGQWLTNPWAIYESSTGREVMRWDQMQAGLMMVGDTAFSPDGKQLAVISDRKLTLLDAQRWQRIAEQEAPANLTCVGFSPDDRSILTGNVTGTLTWWEAATLHKNVEVNAHNAALSAIVFSPDGETLASADKDEIVLWEANRRARIHSISAQSVPLYSLAFAPDGKRLAVGKRDLSVRVYAYHRRRWGQRLD